MSPRVRLVTCGTCGKAEHEARKRAESELLSARKEIKRLRQVTSEMASHNRSIQVKEQNTLQVSRAPPRAAAGRRRSVATP